MSMDYPIANEDSEREQNGELNYMSSLNALAESDVIDLDIDLEELILGHFCLSDMGLWKINQIQTTECNHWGIR